VGDRRVEEFHSSDRVEKEFPVKYRNRPDQLLLPVWFKGMLFILHSFLTHSFYVLFYPNYVLLSIFVTIYGCFDRDG
jgi:hypothetical protein